MVGTWGKKKRKARIKMRPPHYGDPTVYAHHSFGTARADHDVRSDKIRQAPLPILPSSVRTVNICATADTRLIVPRAVLLILFTSNV